MEMTIVRNEELDPDAFLDLLQKDPGTVKSIRLEPPRLGHKGFGRIVVEYTVPRIRRRR
jgi:hypothetical protein